MQKMNHFLLKTFSLKQEEVQVFSLLFFHSFFLGLFIAFYFVPANAVFIQNFGSQQLPIAYMAAGAVGYLSTFIYSSLQKKVSSRSLFLGALIFMMIITLIGRISLFYISEKWLSFFVFIWAWPFISLVGIEAGGLSLRFLNLIQVKRLFGLFNMGGVMASIIGYFTIPLIMPFIGHSYNLLWIGLLGILASMSILISLFKSFPDKSETEYGTAKSESNITFRNLFKEKYFFLIFTSASLSMIVIYISDFGFLSSIKAQNDLFASPKALSQFMALVYGGLKIGELIISYFSSRLLSKYGVRLGLTILPFATSFFIICASVIGLTVGEVSLGFLILMTLNKSFERILRRGLDDPAFNILYQPLPNENKLAVQTKVGVVQQLAIGIAGVFLFFVNLILHTDDGRFLLNYFPLFFLPVLALWVFISNKLYLSYKGKLRQILVDITRSSEKKTETTKYLYGSEVLTKKLKKPNDTIVNMSVTILSETNPRLLEPYATSLLESKDIAVQRAILRSIDPTWRHRILDTVKRIFDTTDNEEVKTLAGYAGKNLDFSGINHLKIKEIDGLSKSQKTEEKLAVIKFLFKNTFDEDENIIIRLLDDEKKLIKSAAIHLAGKRRSPILISKLIDLLDSPVYCHVAGSVLIDIGDKVLQELEIFFSKNKNIRVLLKIVEILSKIGSTPAKSILLAKIDYPNREVQFAIIWALYFCRFQAETREISIIRKKIDETVENILWLIASLNEIEEEKNTLKLFMAMDQEKEIHFEILFELLSFIYEPRMINLIRKNILGKNTIFALEIIDNFISPDIKQLIVPLFDDISDNQRLRKLNYLFPQQKMIFSDRLKAIITRDYNKIDIWSITKAIEILGRLHRSNRVPQGYKSTQTIDYRSLELWNVASISNTLEMIRKSEMPDEVFLCLFHSDELVYSTAAKIIHEENPIKCFDYLSNMSEEKQNLLAIISNEGQVLGDKIKILKRHPMYFNIPEKLMVKLAMLSRVKEFKKGEPVYLKFENSSEDVFIIMKGALVTNYERHDEGFFFKNDIIIRGINIPPDTEYLSAKKDCLIFIVNRNDYFNLFLEETDIIKHFFNEIVAEPEV